MGRNVKELESELLSLDRHDRAALAKTLLESLETLSDAEYDELWAVEAEARLDDFEAGRTGAVDGDEVFARARLQAQHPVLQRAH